VTPPGGREFVKRRAGASAADFEAEAAGLRWLQDAGAPVPEILAVEAEPPALVLERIEVGALTDAGAEQLGRDLASIHTAGAPAFGALPPGSPDRKLRIGMAHLTIAERADWTQLYAEDLVLPLAARARDGGTLSASDAAAVESASGRLRDLAGPDEPPARLHGDLWTGNVLADRSGAGWLIDPAAYGGHREVDLAMLRLFGAPSERIFSAYDEAFPLTAGHGDRIALWQLLPLLVHAVLFGGSYGAAAGDAARNFV
jgi:fructosamine-3-kinase